MAGALWEALAALMRACKERKMELASEELRHIVWLGGMPPSFAGDRLSPMIRIHPFYGD